MSPSSTAKWALPYPIGSDPVADGDNAIRALAERVDTVMGPVDKNPVGLVGINGWAAGPSYYLLRSGWVYLFLQLTKATWGGSEGMLNLPAEAWPLSHVYFGAVRGSDDVVIGCVLSAATGGLTVLQGGASGVNGIVSYPMK